MNWELAFGLIGTITGILSLSLIIYKEIYKEKANLKIDYFTYMLKEIGEGDYDGPNGYFLSEVQLANKGNKNTSITKLYFSINGYLMEAKPKKIKFPIDVYSNSNIIIEFEKFMGIPEYDKIKDFELKKSPMEFKIFVSHTYGKIEEKKLIN